MQSRSRHLTVGSVTLVIALVIFFPARVAYRWFAPDALSLAGISGTIWNGQAREAYASGLHLRDLRWHIQPGQLLTGNLGYRTEASPPSGFVDAHISIGISGTVAVTDLRASLSLQALQQMLARPGLRGKANVQFERLIMDQGLPVAADGIIEVANLVAPKVHHSSIGGYRAEFFTQESGVMASVEDTDGVIDMAGSLQIANDRSYQFIAQLAPKNNTPADVRQQMQYLGSENERGQYELRIEGIF